MFLIVANILSNKARFPFFDAFSKEAYRIAELRNFKTF